MGAITSHGERKRSDFYLRGISPLSANSFEEKNIELFAAKEAAMVKLDPRADAR